MLPLTQRALDFKNAALLRAGAEPLGDRGEGAVAVLGRLAGPQLGDLVTEPGGPTNQIPVGPILDLLPTVTVTDDGTHIDLSVAATLNEIIRLGMKREDFRIQL